MTDRGNDSAATAAADELATLRAEVLRLRAALQSREEPRARRLMESDPDLPGLVGLWRGEGGFAWQLFVQAFVTIIAVLAVVAIIAIAGA
jgi:hypothetical protein